MDLDNSLIQENNKSDKNTSNLFSNPLSSAGKIAKMNAISPMKTAKNMLHSANNPSFHKYPTVVDYAELLTCLSEAVSVDNGLNNLFYSLPSQGSYIFTSHTL